MTSEQLLKFHQWLYGALPCSYSVLESEVSLVRRMVPETQAWMPNGMAELSKSLIDLEIRGLVVKEGSRWRWLEERKEEAKQKGLW